MRVNAWIPNGYRWDRERKPGVAMLAGPTPVRRSTDEHYLQPRLSTAAVCIAFAATAITACGDEGATASSSETTGPFVRRAAVDNITHHGRCADDVRCRTNDLHDSAFNRRRHRRQEAAAVCRYGAAIPSVPARKRWVGGRSSPLGATA